MTHPSRFEWFPGMLKKIDDDEEAYDMSELIEDEDMDEWTAERLLAFAEWFGYIIEPNPESSLGFSVTSPSGKRLGGFVASRIIAGWQSNPNPEAGGGPGKKGKKKAGGKGGGAKKAAKSPEEKAAEREAKAQGAAMKKEQTAALKLEESKSKAAESLMDIDPADMALRSKGKMSAKDLESFKAKAASLIANAKDPKEIAAILRQMKRDISTYKREATKPPTLEQALSDTKAKLKDNLPSAKVLAGTKFDEHEIQGLIDQYSKGIANAGTAKEAQYAVKEMKKAIAEYKVGKAKAEAVAKKAAADAKKAQAAQTKALKGQSQVLKATPAQDVYMATAQPVKPAPASGDIGVNSQVLKKEPVTASEWAEYYTELYLG